MRPVTRRWEPNDLETARRVVSRAERQALDKAEQLRKQAEDLLKAASSRGTDAISQARKDVAREVDSLRAEMESASRRATAAEAELEEFKKQRSVELELFQSQSDELEQLRKRLDASLNGSAFDRPPLDASEGADSAGADMLDPDSFFSGFMARMSEDTQRLMESATAAASRINAEAESELAKAREYAEEITREARKEAEDLLRTAVDAIDRDTTLTDAAREKAESDASTALRAREDAERALAKARSDADQLLAAARSEAERLINEGQTRHDQLIQAAQTEVEGKLGAARDDLADEIAGFRSFLDGVRSRVEEMGRSAGENGSSSAIDLRDGRIVAPPPKIVSH